MRKKEINEFSIYTEILGDYKLTNSDKNKLVDFENTYGPPRGAKLKIILNFIKYGLDDWEYRYEEIKKLKNTITKDRYILMMGEDAGSEHWSKISQKKKYSQSIDRYIGLFGEKKGREIFEDISRKRGKSAFSIEYWVNNGLSEEEAIKKIKENSKKGSKISNEKQRELRELDYESWAVKMSTTKYYWMNTGLSEEEAIEKVRERQTTFSKDICIKQYGEEKGIAIWKERQDKWQATLNSKTDDEKMQINLKKINNMKFGAASKESMMIFSKIIEFLKDNSIKYYVGIEGNSEYVIYANGRPYMYDFVIPSLQLCFEYNGEGFHPNPKWLTNNPKKWYEWRQPFFNNDAFEKRKFDMYKNSLLESMRGFKVIELWSSDPIDFNIEKALQEIKLRLNLIS